MKGLQSCSEKGTILSFQEKSLAIDCSSWLHKSVYSISEHYVEAYEQNQIDHKCIEKSANYVFYRCQELLQSAKIREIYLVMDGKRCPLKAVTNEDRERRRRANLEEARALKQQGKHSKSEEKYKACIKIGDELTKRVIKEVKRRCQQCNLPVHDIWSPYEADAQMVKLCMDGVVDAIVTEVRRIYNTFVLLLNNGTDHQSCSFLSC